MRKLMIGTILSVTCACGCFFYAKWDTQRVADSVPESPIVEQQTVDAHPHETPVLETPPANTGVFEPKTNIVENSMSTTPKTEDSTTQVDAAEQTKDVEEKGAAWQTDDAHEHKSTRSPFARELPDISEMDPDELADMLLVGLLKRFGDIPEVHTFMELERKRFKNQPWTLDERIDFTRAQYHLWPDPRTKESLEIFLERRATEYPRSTKIVR
ncbi:hypothetical protein F4Z99_03845 [Candidatus Poribacteria bacterium]|nr:hypothetical protein [Candidatus Poribacteria bacterium]